MSIDRYWLLTWTAYGTWLPGDSRGSVSPVRGDHHRRVVHNIPGEPFDPAMPKLAAAARRQMKSDVVYLNRRQAGVLLGQCHETAHFREWKLFAVALMASHVHLVVGVPGDPDPANLLRDFKSYGSRAMNRLWPRETSWWSESGSRRVLRKDADVLAAVRYVRDQENPLLVWIDDGISQDIAAVKPESGTQTASGRCEPAE